MRDTELTSLSRWYAPDGVAFGETYADHSRG
jgi:hypothetical protein